MEDSKFINAREKLRKSYELENKKKTERKLIVITTQHIEDDIKYRKRRK